MQIKLHSLQLRTSQTQAAFQMEISHERQKYAKVNHIQQLR